MYSQTKSKLALTILLIAFIICSTLVLAISFKNSEQNIASAAWEGSGTGTASDPYLIGTKAELKKFRDIVNGLNEEPQNTAACAILTSDIDLENEQ